MLFSTRVPLDALVLLCRTLRYGLGAGLSLLDVFRQQAVKGPVAVRPVATEISRLLDKGESLEDALKETPDRFPPLFLAMTAVGEQTGHLPEVFRELEKYFMLEYQLRKSFLRQISWPVFQLVSAIGVIALLILILGLIAGQNKAFDVLGIGTGPVAAMRFLLFVFGCAATLAGTYLVLTRTMKQKPAVDAVLLRMPVLGPTIEALALSRFCLALRLTMGAGLAVKPSLKHSLRATGNALFASRVDLTTSALKRGHDLTEILSETQLFPMEFLNIVSTAEESGRVPEVMAHQADFYQEEAERRMRALTSVAGWGVYFFVACLIVFCIFRIYSSYFALLDKAASGQSF